jgi:hypothetical protein
MWKCNNAQTYLNGIAQATASPKMAQTAACISNQYDHNAEDQDCTSIIPNLPSEDAGRKMKACERQQTEWLTRIVVITVALPKEPAVHYKMDGSARKFVLTSNIIGALQQRFQQKSYLGHLSSSETFVKSSKLATISTTLRECLDSESSKAIRNSRKVDQHLRVHDVD